MRLILLAVIIATGAGCTVVAWSSNIGVETTDGLIVVEDDKQEKTQANKAKAAP